MINIRDDNQTHTHKRTVPLPSSFLSSPSFSFSSPLPFLLYIIPFSPSPRSLPLVLPLQHRSLNNVGSVSSRGRRAHRCFSVANGKWQYIHYLCPHSSFLSLWLLHTHTHSHAHTHTPHTHTHTHTYTHKHSSPLVFKVHTANKLSNAGQQGNVEHFRQVSKSLWAAARLHNECLWAQRLQETKTHRRQPSSLRQEDNSNSDSRLLESTNAVCCTMSAELNHKCLDIRNCLLLMLCFHLRSNQFPWERGVQFSLNNH